MIKVNNFGLIYLLLFVFASCNLPEKKELKTATKKEINKIIGELKLEQFQYSFSSKSKNGNTTNIFYVDLFDIEDSVDFKPYNDRIIDAFENSDYDLKSQDFIRIGYFRKYIPVDLYVYYDIDPSTRMIIKEGYR